MSTSDIAAVRDVDPTPVIVAAVLSVVANSRLVISMGAVTDVALSEASGSVMGVSTCIGTSGTASISRFVACVATDANTATVAGARVADSPDATTLIAPDVSALLKLYALLPPPLL
ncbi:hypothetical protein PF002_g11864 [Phytophthora fragariae]|nr:hypothetical protein PF002_g11864 [Phytophthora fragariae]